MATMDEGYREAVYWKLDRRTTVIANLIGVAVLPLALVGFTLVASSVRRVALPDLGASMNQILSTWQGMLVMIALVLGVVVVHEATHASVMRLFGKQPTFGALYKGLAFYAAAPGQSFTRNQWIVVALAPLIVLSIAGCALILILPAAVLSPLVYWLAVNAAGSGADAWMSARVLRYPAIARVVDEGDGVRVLLPGSGSGS